MIITDAFWEKRNLGCDVCEISCEADDTEESLTDELAKVKTPYSVVKIPSEAVELLLTAQQLGYRLIETTTAIEGSMKKIAMPKMYQRFIDQIRMEYADEEMENKVLEEIRSGAIFETDRIAVDPHFSKRIAGERYYNWCKDAMEKGAKMGVAYYRDEPAAFNISILKEGSNGIWDGLIGGLFQEAFHTGLGFLVVYTETELCRLGGGRKCLGRVSSNNVPILRLHVDYGFDIRDVNYVLIKHQ